MKRNFDNNKNPWILDEISNDKFGQLENLINKNIDSKTLKKIKLSEKDYQNNNLINRMQNILNRNKEYENEKYIYEKYLFENQYQDYISEEKIISKTKIIERLNLFFEKYNLIFQDNITKSTKSQLNGNNYIRISYESRKSLIEIFNFLKNSDSNKDFFIAIDSFLNLIKSIEIQQLSLNSEIQQELKYFSQLKNIENLTNKYI